MIESRDHCIRCGECCLKASPTLQKEDLGLYKSGFIKYEALYTVRQGELVRDNIKEELVVTPTELIKVKEKDEGKGSCCFYDEDGKGCTVYSHRPVQCAVLKCWDTSELIEVQQGRKLVRKDIIKDETLLGIIAEHEKRCSYALLEKYVKQIESLGEKAVEKILDILKFDYELRPFMTRKLDLHPKDLDFFFGRPLTETIAMFGFRIVEEPDGSFLFTTLE
ncbi:YkgJ family cysteine cluster protein [Thermodesulfobacteriota bacterium]